MKQSKTQLGRRSFLKASAVTGGGLLLQFNFFASPHADAAAGAEAWSELNAFLSIAADGRVLMRVPNPEFGQNLMTSMPMVMAEELDVAWSSVQAEQAPYDASRFGPRQFSGGSQSIRQSWTMLRTVGATARDMLRTAAATEWQVPLAEITTHNGQLIHAASGRRASYADMAPRASTIEPPKQVTLKQPEQFDIVGTSRANLVGADIVSGKPLFNGDFKRAGMRYATVVHPPAFGQTLGSYDAESVLGLPGIDRVFSIKTYNDDYGRNYFDVNAFPEVVAIVGDSTWQVLKAAKALQVQWRDFDSHQFSSTDFGGNTISVAVPAGRESSVDHEQAMDALLTGGLQVRRQDGDPAQAFADAAKVIERTYSAPYLAHNMMEPLNFFAHVTEGHAEMAGPLQGPVFIQQTLAARLGLSPEQINVTMTRMGGGFGRRAYAHYAVEAALISKEINAPVQLQYSREQCMTQGNFRPAYKARIRAALDADGNMTAYHVAAVGVPESPVHEHRFPAGAVDHYLAEAGAVPSNITIAAFRAPRSNFIAAAEQSFLDEVAEAAGRDPIEFRLALLQRAQHDPVGSNNDYDAARYAAVIELVRDKSGWQPGDAARRGMAAYFCHNSYAAHVIDMRLEQGKPIVDRVCTAMDCGIVVNTDSARNMVEGGTIDGIGNALFGEMPFVDGAPQKNNLDHYRLIRLPEAPKQMDVHFVESTVDPTGLGEPPFPPAFAAVANALYRATGKRFYKQPFITAFENV